ncbi:UvrD-helicase domain-containing protein [Uniformispora flossi]|uniref:UvrD-helicase domain-containing protein n=1 Tax=Uniformispora flossi TaxID=3390723 RepID=UPI003C306A27
MAVIDAIAEVEAALDGNESFLVEAGAGSGKTTALVHGLRHLLDVRGTELSRTRRLIACITFTNVAKQQISERIAADPRVYVGTIHEFLWHVISNFQDPLRTELLTHNMTLRRPTEDLESALPPGTQIIYSDRGRRFAHGEIGHDDVLALASRMVTRYPKLARIVADRFPVIFVDEYQDTSPTTLDILLNHVAVIPDTTCVIGLFGDSMQKIYRTGIGKVEHPRLRRITKFENYRCSQPVVTLLNHIRPELQQHVAGPSRNGEVLLLLNSAISSAAERLAAARQLLSERGWNDEESKYLQLTHRGIAGTLDYANLLKVYADQHSFARDDLLDASEPYAKYAAEIEHITQAYSDQEYGELGRLLGLAGTWVTRHEQKAAVVARLKTLCALRNTGTIGDVVDFASRQDLLRKPARIRAIERDFERTDLDEAGQASVKFAQDLRAVAYQEMAAICRFRNEQTPFATQHGVKGDEFPNVVVLIEDGSWTQFHIGKMMAGTDKPERTERSRNLFYVCCSRAVNNLAVVFLSDLPEEASSVARAWFAGATVVP